MGYRVVYITLTCYRLFILFVLRLNVPVNLFFSHVGTEQTLLGFNQFYRELMCLAQGHNTVTPVGIEFRTSRFGVRHCYRDDKSRAFFASQEKHDEKVIAHR